MLVRVHPAGLPEDWGFGDFQSLKPSPDEHRIQPIEASQLEAEAARHRVEERLYLDVGIPTHQVAADELDTIVVENLLQLLLWQKRTHSLEEGQVTAIVDAFNDGISAGTSALEVWRVLELSEGISEYEAKIVMYQAIWNRRLRVNLFKRFWPDEPMEPEVRDVLNEYAQFFRRPTP